MLAARTLVHKGALPVLKRIVILWFLLLWDTCPQDSPDCLLLQKILNVQFRLWFYVSLFSDNQNISVLQSDIIRPKFYSFRYNGALICMPDKRFPVSGLLPDQNCRIRKLKKCFTVFAYSMYIVSSGVFFCIFLFHLLVLRNLYINRIFVCFVTLSL